MFKKIFRLNIDGKNYKITIEETENLKELEKLEQLTEINTEEHVGSNCSISCYQDENWIDDHSKTIDAPMAGIIVEIDVEKGSIVKAGDLIVILEAMKMENEIRSPRSGKVKEVLVSPGEIINQGDTIITFE